MITVNMHEAKTRLCQLVAAALEGEEDIVCSNGEPRVRLARVIRERQIRRDLTPDPRFGVKLAPGQDPTYPDIQTIW